MPRRIENPQGQQGLALRGSGTGSSDGKSPSGTSQRLHLRGLSDATTPPPTRPGSSSSSRTPIPRSFNPEASEFSPTVSVNSTPRSAYASPTDANGVESSVQRYLAAQRENRLRQINQIEDERDREEAMNDFIWNQHTEWSAEDLAKEKEEKELQERREKFGHNRQNSRK